jgi:hypothetical protein
MKRAVAWESVRALLVGHNESSSLVLRDAEHAVVVVYGHRRRPEPDLWDQREERTTAAASGGDAKSCEMSSYLNTSGSTRHSTPATAIPGRED